MGTVVRFAPSPTGRLHVGNARVALINGLLARRSGGRFLLRFDDTDLERSKEEHVAAIRRDLSWLGLAWDEEFRQSDRLAAYDAATQRLKAAGRIYPCFETAEELEFKRRAALRAGRPPIYDRAALKLDDAARAQLEAEGRRPHWRFKLDHAAIAWDDAVRGPVHFEGGHLGDPVVVRADGSYLYMLPSVIDDVDMGITHVIRGEDHVTNTAVQIQMFEALGAEPPVFAHLPLLSDPQGKKLSKRLDGLSLEELRAAGIEPLALAAYLAHLGTGEAGQLAQSLDQLATPFELGHFGRAAPHFDPAELNRLNARLLHGLSFAEARARLADLEPLTAEFWDAVRGNIERLGEARDWHGVCYAPTAPLIDEPEFAAQAAALLPETIDEGSWETWTKAVAGSTGRKGKALFLPLRRALTGRDHGPEMKRLLPLIGRERALARLAGRAA